MSPLKTLLEIDARYSRQLRLKPEAWPGWHRVGSFLAHSGDSWFLLPVLGLIWLFAGCTWHNRAALMGIGLVFLAAAVLAIKFTVRRSRPPGEWGEIYRSTDPHSFPSGHAARVTYLAVMAVGLGPAWLAILLVLWAPLVGLARIAMGVHYLSDIVAGMSIGLLWGAMMLLLAEPILHAFSFLPFVFCTAGL
jgi:undecaprenyl-diphosphatase